ncbi:hypothetical protein Moror_11387 [Moniliophthora roreri MCA 2997]|uniref:F-box domain-containing protein n=1 Tax=Moniliophthora roreri (strain MCA 2997) TaxID=1381753 RepID=V2WYI8_MONRO|nr:hypothetical protein Moror_11387 [Moniliophthora roreri MCA 2997]
MRIVGVLYGQYGFPHLPSTHPKEENFNLSNPSTLRTFLITCIARATELPEALERATLLLESISLHNVGKLHGQGTVYFPDFPWSRIREVELEDRYDETKICQVLRQCKRLETLILHSPLNVHLCEVSAQLVPVTLPNLGKIQLCTAGLCTCLSLSALQHMDLIKVQMVGRDLDIVMVMIKRSGCGHRLEYLSIGDISMMDVTVERLLRLTLNIKELVLSGHVVSGYILERIAMALPELHSLLIRHGLDRFQSTLAPPPLSALVQLVKKKNKAQNTKLRKVRLEAYEEVVLEKDVLEKLETLSSPELVVDIRLDPGKVDRYDRLLYLRDVLYRKLCPLPTDPVLMRNLIEAIVDYLFRIWENLEVDKASQSDAGAILARIIADIEIPREEESHIRARARRFYIAFVVQSMCFTSNLSCTYIVR